jgi:hypothetical protein
MKIPLIDQDNCHISAYFKCDNEHHTASLVNCPSSLQTAENNTKIWVQGLDIPEDLTSGVHYTPKPFKGSMDNSPTHCGDSSSLEEDDGIVTDLDLLSVSDTSDPGLCLDIGPLSLMQSHMVDYILKDYRATKRCQNGVDAHITPTTSTSNQSTYSGSQTSSGKRKYSDQEYAVGTDSGPSQKVAKGAREKGICPKVLACPFWKHASQKHRVCCKLTLKRIRDVKQHLHRRHTPDNYCDRCLEVFENDDQYETHLLNIVACSRVPGSRLEGISRNQNRALCKKSDRKLGEEDQWFAMWDILFPGATRPASAYVDSGLTEEMTSFQEYWTNRGHEVLMNELNSNNMWSLSPEEREVQGRQILARGLNLIYEQWAGLGRIASTIPPDLAISTSPPATSTTESLLLPIEENPKDPISNIGQAKQAIAVLPDQAVVGITVTGDSQAEGFRSQSNFFQLGSQIPATSNASINLSLPSHEMERGDMELCFSDIVFSGTTLEGDLDFNISSEMGSFDTI